MMAIVLAVVALLAIPIMAETGGETRSTVEFGPDLAVNSGDIVISKTSLLAGVEFNVSVKVYNLGDEDALDVDVDLLVDTEPVKSIVIDQVAVDGWETAMFSLSLTQGDHSLTILVDPSDAIDERREDNNDATKDVNVRGLPDASVLANGITVSDAHPMEGDVLTVSATIENLGESTASLVVVQFWDGLPDWGDLIANRTTSIPEGGQSLVTTQWDTTGLGGTHEVYVYLSRVMPGEDNKANNMASVPVLIFTQWDLVIDAGTGDVTIDQERIQDGFVTVREGATLTIAGINFRFLQDYDNQFALFVEDGGSLVLIDALVRSDFALQVFLEDGTSLLLSSDAELWADVRTKGDVTITIVDSILDGNLHGSAALVRVTDSDIYGTLDIENALVEIEATNVSAASPCRFHGATSVLVDSSFVGTASPSLLLSGGATVELRNVTCGGVQTDGTSTAFVFRRVEVLVVDESSMVVPGATIEVRHYINGTVVGTTTGGEDGKASVEVLSDVIQAGESHFIGNYIIWSSFSGKEGTEPLLLTPFPAMGPESNLPKASVVLPPVEPRGLMASTPGDLVIDAGKNMTLVADYIQDGNILVKGSLTIANSKLSVLQDRGHQFYIVVEGNGKLVLLNGELTSNYPINLYLYDKAALEMSPGSTLFTNAIVAEDSATISASASQVMGRFLVRGGRIALESGCTVEGDLLVMEAPSVSIQGGSVEAEELLIDAPVVSFDGVDLDANGFHMAASTANMTDCRFSLVTMSVEATIFTITGSSLLTAEPMNLSVATLYVDSSSSNHPIKSDRTDSKIYFTDADVPRPYVMGNATVEVYWYLTVIVEDVLSNPVSGSEVSVTYTQNGTEAASGISNDDGNVRLPLLGSVVGPDGERFVGNYMIRAVSPKDPGDEVTRFVNLDGAKTLVLNFDGIMVPPTSISVEIRVANTTIVAGNEFTVTGAATAIFPTIRNPLDQGTVEIILWTNGSTWTNTTALSSEGTFSFSIPAPMDDGVYYLKAVVTPTGDYSGVTTGSSNVITLDITAPGPSTLFIVLPTYKITDFPTGGTLVIRGWVKYNTAQGAPASNVRVFLEDPVTTQIYQTQADGLGVFEFPPRIGPSYFGQYDYFLSAKDNELDIETPEKVKMTIVAVEPPKEEEESINLLLWSIVIIIVVVAVIAGTLGYWAFSSKGRMVECGECGTLVRDTATECPKCGIEFEVEVAKCSVCESWIKSDATHCPYCNTPFKSLEEGSEGGDEKPPEEGEGASGDVVADVQESAIPSEGAPAEAEEDSLVTVKQVPEGLKKEVRPRPVVQKRAVKEFPGDVENGGHADIESGGLAPRPRVVKKMPAQITELEEEMTLHVDEPGLDLDLQEDQEES